MSTRLGFLLELQDALGGAIPFERWMREALYHPEYGYYTANIRGIGRQGDFTTWPVMRGNLAKGVAKWALAHRPKGRWHLIEVGAGSGDLADAVLRETGWWNRPSYHIVEVSPVLREAQEKKLKNRVNWRESLREALAACGGEALIFSNELADAFPCRVFQKQGGGWRELALRIEGGKVSEIWQEAALPDATAFAHDWPDGQRVEVQTSYRSWLEEWAPEWKKGAMLTIDYGDECLGIYHRRPRGTLRAYAHHQRLEGEEVYGGFGQRDLTVDVNFSDLAKWSPWAGNCMSLAEFLGRQGVAAGADFAAPGEAFKVLEQVNG